MKRLLLAAFAAALVTQPALLSGQIYYNGVPNQQEYLDFLGGSGVGYGGVQVGPYVGRFTSDPYPAQSFSIYCVDFNHYAQDQRVWVTALSPSADLDHTRLDNYSRYRTAAYLSSLFDTAPATGASWGPIHRAIWSVTSTVPNNTWDDFLTPERLAAAQTFNTAGWYVVSPRGYANGQEFLMRTRVSVPEPATFLLLASGLLMLAAASRKRITGLREQDA